MVANANYAPIVVFGYKRLDKIKACLAALEECAGALESDLFLFVDGPKSDKDREDVFKVQNYLEEWTNQGGFKNIELICQEKNRGLANSIISGVTQVINKYGKVIVVEDDLIVNKGFIRYMNGALDYYSEDKRYGSISAYCSPMKSLERYDKDVFATYKAECWGWATWSDRWNDALWQDVDYDSYFSNFGERRRLEALEAGLDRLMCLQKKGKIDSWAIRWVYYLFKNNQWTIYPKHSFVSNEGFDGSGTHCNSVIGVDINCDINMREFRSYRFEFVEVDDKLAKAYGKFSRGNLIRYYLELLRYYIWR